MFTDKDLAQQVTRSIDGLAHEFNVSDIVDEIQAEYGTVDIETIDDDRYWDIVSRHDITERDAR